jgi:hypothetical protein
MSLTFKVSPAAKSIAYTMSRGNKSSIIQSITRCGGLSVGDCGRPYASPTKVDLRQIFKGYSEDLELELVEQLRVYYPVPGIITVGGQRRRYHSQSNSAGRYY